MSKLEECLKRYWELIVQENYPKTPEITKELDALEEFIKSANAAVEPDPSKRKAKK